ncbi:multiheme c-type cytochrome [bacterium]|nr:multiheme c-type cytochrome [bacterium]
MSPVKIFRYSHLTPGFAIFALVLCLSPIQLQAAAEYVGRETCEQCHAEQVKLWQGSHHDLAMQHVDENTVLGDFSDAEFSYAGITSKFYKKNNKFMVRTDGPDGALQDYEIKYTFGVVPLQQYLIELDGGRLQALTIAWDSRKKSEGGQRWFHLYPDQDITYKDELHWTRVSFNWNGMCAECHSTNLQKNYDTTTDTFKTSWSEIDVSCESCHGPASDHVSWAKKKPEDRAGVNKGLALLLDERDAVIWRMDIEKGSAARSQKREADKEIEVCAQCHSRRGSISDDYSPGKLFLNHYMPRLLDEGMYFADGQIQDEVYVYGSFIQSKMYHQGVTCSDCHEPHSLQLRQEGNGVCLQCHAAEKFDSKKHHFHDMGDAGASCAECHMPPRDYMVVDPRHDHSMRIPRPDLSVKTGVPNACNNCHEDEDASWALSNTSKWYSDPVTGFQQYTEALHAARTGDRDAGKLLAAQIRDTDTPDIARATSLSLLPSYLDQANAAILQAGLKDENALVRLASVSALENLPAQIKVQWAYPLLSDEVRGVRIEAARILASIPLGELPEQQRKVVDSATQEYIYSQTVNADRPESQLNLGNFYVAKQQFDKAKAAYQKSIELDSSFIAAYINMADLYRLQKNDKDANTILEKAKQLSPDNADVYYALGLSLIRQHKNDKAVSELKMAAELAQDNARYVYVYAVALNSTGDSAGAIQQLQAAHQRFPADVDILSALVSFHRDTGNQFAAETYMKKLQKLSR